MTAITLAIAMIFDAVFGEPDLLWKRFPHPAVLMGRTIGWFDGVLNEGPARKVKGVITVICLVICAGVIGWCLSLIGMIAEVIVVAVILAQRSLVQHVSAVADGLRLSLAQGRRSVAMIVSRDTAEMEAPAISRSAIESAAENLSDGVIAPAFWFLIAGLPGLLIYKIINTADSMIGYRTPRHADFGWAAARLDDVLNWIPARLTAIMIAFPGGVLSTWPAIRGDAHLHRSPNAGWPEAAMARAIDAALAGPRPYDGQMQNFPWVHVSGTRNIGPTHIDAAIKHLWLAWVTLLICVISVGLFTI